MQDKLKPALIGGVALGFASGIPIINIGNCICCAWVIGGGVLATYLYLREAAPSAQPPYGDTALVGALTGVVGAVVSSILSALFSMLFSSADVFGQLATAMEGQDVPPEVQEMLANLGSGGGGCISFFISVIVLSIIYPIFAVVGALIGTAVFHKNAPQAPSYPPPGSAPPPPPPTT